MVPFRATESGRDGNRFILVFGFHQKITAQLFFGFCKRPSVTTRLPSRTRTDLAVFVAPS